MIVNNLNSMAGVYTSSALGSARYANYVSSARNVQKRDELSLSSEAQSFSEILKKLHAESDVRQEKVTELEQKISSGSYNVSADEIAMSLLTYRF